MVDSEGEWRVMRGEEGGEGDCRERTVVDSEDTVESMEDV